MKKILLIFLIPFFTYSCSKKESTPTFISPAVIPIITIGTQKWMGKNLDVVTYRNGDTIPQVTDAIKWGRLTTGAWCYYNNDAANGTKYGKLYNWYAVNDSRGLAPLGWHMPSDAEWTTLSTFLGGEVSAGGKLKELGTLNWQTPNKLATNDVGFSALPGGYHSGDGSFYYVGDIGSWWSATENSRTGAWGRSLNYYNGTLGRDFYYKGNGFSVRCLKD
jgi:uncharacterized protein (TIGR02145 family)